MSKIEEPREKTPEEVRDEFLRHVWFLIDYWDRVEIGTKSKTRLEGLAHSILSTIDGMSTALPGFDLVC